MAVVVTAYKEPVRVRKRFPVEEVWCIGRISIKANVPGVEPVTMAISHTGAVGIRKQEQPPTPIMI